MEINTGFRLKYLTSLKDVINSGTNQCFLFNSAQPSPATVRNNLNLYASPTYSSNVISSISITSTTIAVLTNLNNGIDIQFEPEPSVFSVNSGTATWFMFINSSYPLYIWGNVDIPANHPDVAILNPIYTVGREVDFQNIKIRLLQLNI